MHGREGAQRSTRASPLRELGHTDTAAIGLLGALMVRFWQSHIKASMSPFCRAKSSPRN